MTLAFHQQARALGRQLEAAGVTQNQLAVELGVSQSQVSRLLNGQAKRRSQLFERLRAYAGSLPGTAPHTPVTPAAEIFAAIKETLDGTPEHARALAHVIRAVAVLHERQPRRKSRESTKSIPR